MLYFFSTVNEEPLDYLVEWVLFDCVTLMRKGERGSESP